MWVNSRCAIAAWLECFQEKPRTVSGWTGLPGEESVKRFERSNGLDTALYKTIPFYLFTNRVSLVYLKITVNFHVTSINNFQLIYFVYDSPVSYRIYQPHYISSICSPFFVTSISTALCLFILYNTYLFLFTWTMFRCYVSSDSPSFINRLLLYHSPRFYLDVSRP